MEEKYCVYFGIARGPLQCTVFAHFLTIFRVRIVLHDNSSPRIGSVSCVDPPGGADATAGRAVSQCGVCVRGTGSL